MCTLNELFLYYKTLYDTLNILLHILLSNFIIIKIYNTELQLVDCVKLYTIELLICKPSHVRFIRNN